MPVERAPGGTSLIDVLDRVLDKGIIIDAWVRVSLVGIDLVTVEATRGGSGDRLGDERPHPEPVTLDGARLERG